MTIAIDRRRFMTAASVLTAAGGAVAGAAVAHAHQSDILALSDRFWALHQSSSSSDGSPEAEARAEAMVAEYIAAAERIAGLQAVTPGELAAKLKIAREMLGHPVDRPVHEDDARCDRIAQRGLWNSILDAERMAG